MIRPRWLVLVLASFLCAALLLLRGGERAGSAQGSLVPVVQAGPESRPRAWLYDPPTPLPSPTRTPTATPSPSSTATPTVTPSLTATITPTATPSPTVTVTPTVSPVPTAVVIYLPFVAKPPSAVSPTAEPTDVVTRQPTASPTATSSPTPTPTDLSVTESPTETPSSTSTPTPESSSTPTLTPSRTATATPTPVPPTTAVSPTPSPTEICGEVIENGDFEQGHAFWTEEPGNIITASWTDPYQGSWVAWFGGYHLGDDRLYQLIHVPMGAQDNQTLRFYLYVETEEPGAVAYDEFYLQFFDQNWIPRSDPIWVADNTTTMDWTYMPISLQGFANFAGQDIFIRFRGTTDYSCITNFVMDAVSLEITCGREGPPPPGPPRISVLGR